MANEQQLPENEIAREAIREEAASQEFAEAEASSKLAEEVASEEVAQEAASEEAEMEEAEYAEAGDVEEEMNSEMLGVSRVATDLAEAGEDYIKPSFFKFFVLGSIAITADIVDLILYLTGVGAFISFFISMIFLALLALIVWFTDTRFKRAQDYIKFIETEAPRLAGQIESTLLKLSRRAVRYGTKLERAGFTQAGTKLTQVGARVSRFAKKNPLTKILLLGAADIVPVLELLPLNSISIYLTYRDEKKTYDEAHAASREVLSISETEPDLV